MPFTYSEEARAEAIECLARHLCGGNDQTISVDLEWAQHWPKEAEELLDRLLGILSRGES
jgi:hypothetical protein